MCWSYVSSFWVFIFVDTAPFFARIAFPSTEMRGKQLADEVDHHLVLSTSLSLSLFLRAFLVCCFFFLGRVIVKFGALNRKRFFFFLIREQPPAKHRTHTCCCSPLMHGTRHMSCTFAGHGRSHAYPLSETGGVNADSGAAAQRIKGADGRVVDRQTLTDNRELRISISPDNI